MKRGLVLLFLFVILSLNFVIASNHTAANITSDVSNGVRSEFTIAGCSTTNSIGEQIDLPANSCSSNGFYYCDANGNLYETLFDSKGCSLGKGTYTAGSSRCCPAGYVCDSGTLVCELGGIECGQYEGSANSCEEAGCYYISESGSCVSSPDEYSCGIYESSTSCAQDTYNLGKQGFGTEVCNSPNTYDIGSSNYVVPQSSCKCVWSGTSCKLQWDFVESIHAGNPSGYQCQIDFDFGECSGGIRKISWTALGFNGTGVFSGSILEEALSAPGCVDGNVDQVCGEPIIKLPGFSLIAGILVVLVLAGFYVFRR